MVTERCDRSWNQPIISKNSITNPKLHTKYKSCPNSSYNEHSQVTQQLCPFFLFSFCFSLNPIVPASFGSGSMDPGPARSMNDPPTPCARSLRSDRCVVDMHCESGRYDKDKRCSSRSQAVKALPTRCTYSKTTRSSISVLGGKELRHD
jgi:hypothetical protein